MIDKTYLATSDEEDKRVDMNWPMIKIYLIIQKDERNGRNNPPFVNPSAFSCLLAVCTYVEKSAYSAMPVRNFEMPLPENLGKNSTFRLKKNAQNMQNAQIFPFFLVFIMFSKQ
jgi:hypothetical protein